jgi:uncharacterized protein YkwD
VRRPAGIALATRGVAVALAVALAALATPWAASGASAASSAPDPAAAEADFVSRINALRQSKGLGPLAVDGELVAFARRWAAKMAADDRISHNPNLRRDAPGDWEKLGENVGVGMTVKRLHDAFVASPSHYRNLVDRDFTRIGVGVVIGRDGALFTAHEFMQPRPSAAAPAAVVTTWPPSPPPPPSPTTTAPAVAAPLPSEPTARLAAVLGLLHELDRR